MEIEPFESAEELVLLIHGTFSAESDDRVRWWQEGSDFWNQFRTQLPRGVRLADGELTFNWSGGNSERARHRAGRELLDRLLEFEERRQPYHLIAHSHGGSVVWIALGEAIRGWLGQMQRRRRDDTKFKLPHLRSWTTVGTPFLQFKTTQMGRWFGAMFQLVVGSLAVVLTGYLVFLLKDSFVDFDIGAAWDALNAKVSATEGLTSAAVIVGVLAIAALPGLAVYFWVSAVRQEALAVRRDQRLRNEAMLEYGSRWLGLWSRDDEAINGLKATLSTGGDLMPRLDLASDVVFEYDRRLRDHRRLIRWFLAPVYNRVIAPFGDSYIWSKLIKRLQGHDRPGCSLVDVTTGPVRISNTYQYPALPEDLDDRLVNRANDYLAGMARIMIDNVRSLLGQSAWGAGKVPGLLIDVASGLTGRELVHTSYFDEPQVQRLLGIHIEECSGERAGRTEFSEADPQLRQWYSDCRETIKDDVLAASSVLVGFPLAGQRNPRAVVALLLGLFGLIPALPCLPLLGLAFPILAVVLGHQAANRAEKGARHAGIASAARKVGIFGLIVAIPLQAFATGLWLLLFVFMVNGALST